MRTTFSFLLCVFLGFMGGAAFGQRPVIAHEAPPSVSAGQRLRLIARVSSAAPLERVSLHLTQSGGVAPVTLAMEPSGGGIYSVAVNPSLFSGGSSFRYYIDAHAQGGDWAETEWMTVRVVGALPEEGETGRSWTRPALIGLGVVGGIGASVALSDSGGGGGDGGGDLPPGVDPADQLLIRTAGDTVSGPAAAVPRQVAVDVADELNGRTINRVRVRLEFDPVDGGEESYEVLYNGRVVFTGSAGNASRTDQVDVAGSADTRVVIRVLNSQAVDGAFAYRWSATVTYFLVP